MRQHLLLKITDYWQRLVNRMVKDEGRYIALLSDTSKMLYLLFEGQNKKLSVLVYNEIHVKENV